MKFNNSRINISLFIGIIVAVLVLCPTPYNKWTIFAVLALWCGLLLRPQIRRIFQKAFLKLGKSHLEGNSSKDKDLQSKATSMSLRQLNHRISARLHSQYPKIIWNWVSKEDASRIAVFSGTTRINIKGAKNYNFADVTLDQYAEIAIQLLNCKDLSNKTADNIIAEFEPKIWYNSNGKNILTEAVGELHSRLLPYLEIDTEGNILLMEPTGEENWNQLHDFPPTEHWAKLCQYFNDIELKAVVNGNRLRVSLG